MADKSKKCIFVVDDDPCICDIVALNLKRAGFRCVCFSNADDCLQQLHLQRCDLIITDVKMPGKSGIELLTEAKHVAPWLPILVMTSYADVPLAVSTVKAGATDFLEKPLEWDSFLKLVQSIVRRYPFGNHLKGKPLTKTEIIILRLVLQNKSNKEIANILHRSVRTVEVHRNHIMHKLDVNSVVELVKRAVAMGLDGAT